MRASHIRPLLPWLYASGPLLLLLLVLGISFGFSENEIFGFFRHHREAHPALKTIFKIITTWSNPAFYAFYAWLLYKAWKEKRPGLKRFVIVYIIVQVAISLIAVRLVKSIIGRPRPGEDPFFQSMTNRPSYHALPSGHTTEATASVMALALRMKGLLIPIGLGLILALVGFSRIYLGWHHPSDVFFGWLLGCVAGFAVHLFSKEN